MLKSKKVIWRMLIRSSSKNEKYVYSCCVEPLWSATYRTKGLKFDLQSRLNMNQDLLSLAEFLAELVECIWVDFKFNLTAGNPNRMLPTPWPSLWIWLERKKYVPVTLYYPFYRFTINYLFILFFKNVLSELKIWGIVLLWWESVMRDPPPTQGMLC